MPTHKTLRQAGRSFSPLCHASMPHINHALHLSLWTHSSSAFGIKNRTLGSLARQDTHVGLHPAGVWQTE